MIFLDKIMFKLELFIFYSDKSETPLYKHSEFSILESIIVKHVIEGIAELIRHLLNFELFTVNLILNIINPEVKENITSHNLAY